jgi:hypothetical protein
MQGGKNWFLPKEMNANRFFCDSHWLEIWSNHFYPSMGPIGGIVAYGLWCVAPHRLLRQFAAGVVPEYPGASYVYIPAY